MIQKRLKIQRGNQKRYTAERQTIQCTNISGQKDKQHLQNTGQETIRASLKFGVNTGAVKRLAVLSPISGTRREFVLDTNIRK
jgi:hypothetical protein